MLIEINDENVEELFEILCAIPKSEMSVFGAERPARIDDIIDQLLDEAYNEKEFCEHKELKQFSNYIDNVEFTDYGMTYNRHILCICQNCKEIIDVIDENRMWKR